MKKSNQPRYLTKSMFVRALECPTKMYYAKNSEYPDKNEEDEFYKSLQDGGFQVEELARLYHPEGHMIDINKYDFNEALKVTKELLKEQKVTIFEAPVLYHKYFLRVDILIKDGDNIDLIEVKSKSIMPKKDSFITKKNYIKADWIKYLYDIAFQTYVLKKVYPGYNINPYLMLVDKSKTCTVDGLNQLIKIERDDNGKIKIKYTKSDLKKDDLGEEILVKIPVKEYIELIWNGEEKDPSKKNEEEKKPFIKRMSEYATYYQRNKIYPIKIGSKCKNCEYRIPKIKLKPNQKSGFEECWKIALKWNDEQFYRPHIFDLWNFRKSQEMLDQEIYFLEDIEFEKVKLNERQKLQITKTIYEKEKEKSEYIDPILYNEMNKWTFPLHFIDFETNRTAIPYYKDRRPYGQVAFQFSIHSIQEDGSITHSAEWINSDPHTFPNYEFVRELKKYLSQDDGTIFQYYPYENQVLNSIYRQLETDKEKIPDAIELMEWIRSITEWKENGQKRHGIRKMVDMHALVKSYYFHPLMSNSNSIKDVVFAVINVSHYLQKIYSKPYTSNNFPKGKIWLEYNNHTQYYKNPYDLLEPIEEGILDIKEGGAAMTAYGLLQYTDLSSNEHENIVKGLLRYCELDTLAMVMIYEHWHNLKLKAVDK